MENEIYDSVNKLMRIFEVEQLSLGQQWAEEFITSARRGINTHIDNRIKPIINSLDEIQSHRDDCNIREFYNDIIRRDGLMHNSDRVLDLASRISADDNLRKFLKVHKLLCLSKAKKQQEQSQHQHQPQSLRRLPQQTPQQSIQQTLQQPSHQTLQQTPSTKLSATSAATAAPIFQTPKPSTSTYRTPLTPYQNNLNSTPMVAITPARVKRDKSRKSEKDMRRKNDVFYQKQKAFLAENQFLSFDFKKIDWTEMPPIKPLSSMSVQEQESALINELLYVLIGTEGKYIRMQPSRDSPNKHTIGVERGGDELVYSSATRIIKICPLYSTVVHYAEDVNYGLVNQALCAPVKDLVEEYLALIANLQQLAARDELTLQSMWYSLQPIFYKMEALKQILDQISRDSCYGGHTLTILHNRVVNPITDSKTYDFCLKLIKAASEPYFEILQRWLYLGVIEDPFGEFFIEDTEYKSETYQLFENNYNSHNRSTNLNNNQQNVDADSFWRKRFTRDDSKVPDFLRSKQERIYDTGKYLSVVRHYGTRVFRPLRSDEPMVYCSDSRTYDERVDEAYKFASKELLDLLLIENKLIDRLHSLKRYFLFSSGDFFVQFMDMADEELSKTKEEINMARLESLLELALRASSCNQDPYKDDVHIKMSNGSLYQMMASINGTNDFDSNEQAKYDYCHSSGDLFGWESLTLSYDVTWPLSMIICRDYCQTLYQMMFRHIFCCKYIESKLEATLRMDRILRFKNCEIAFTLRQRMLRFVNNLIHYITEIIEPSFQILVSKFRDGCIENVNEVIELHRAFLSGLVHDSMLTDNELLGHVTKLLLLCMDFSAIIEVRFASFETELQQQELQNSSRSKSINNLSQAPKDNNETFSKPNKSPNVVVRAMTDGTSSAQGESYVASQIRKLSLSSQNNQQQNPSPTNRMQKSKSIGNLKAKSINPDDIFLARIGEIKEKFNTQFRILLNALTDRSQDHSASSKLQNLFFRLDYNNFYTQSDLAS